MNRDEIKETLLLYRPGSADAEDPQIAEALALAKGDAEMSQWLDEHCARQSALRAKFRQVEPPAGLLEQIVSEHTAAIGSQSKAQSPKPMLPAQRWIWELGHRAKFAMALVVLFGGLAFLWFSHRASDNTLAIFQKEMARVALSPYGMDLTTDDLTAIRVYLARNDAPSNFVVSAALKKANLTGCAVEQWQGANVSMICFRSGKPLPPGVNSDLWLFVVDRAAVENAPRSATPQISKVNRLTTASWSQDGKVYFLGTEGSEAVIKNYL